MNRILSLLITMTITACAAVTPYDHVNASVNRVPYVAENNKPEVWKSPSRFYREGGDCEDYAIAKYYELKKQGVPKTSMFIISMKWNAQQNHAVLWVLGKDKTYVLDNNSMWVLTPDDYATQVINIFDWKQIEDRVK